MLKPIVVLAGLALIGSGAFASLAVNAADHRDSPLNKANPTADINDVFAFRSPENPDNLVVAISVNPLIAPSDNNTRGVFDTAAMYQLHVDNNGDLADDATVTFRVTSNPPQLIIEGLGNAISAPITAPGESAQVTNAGGIKVFAGLRDDPFFFDLTGFETFVSTLPAPVNGLRGEGAGNPVDTFAGTNILAIVVELPITATTGASSSDTGTIKAWVSSTLNGQRIDRMAIPAINTALIPEGQKDAFNAGRPVTDAAQFRDTAQATIEGLRAAVDNLFGTAQGGGPLGSLSPAQVAGALIPDIVTIDFSQPVQFPNGRTLSDDVIDAALGVVLNRGGASGISDGVNGNDKPFSNAFPYLAEPHTAAVAGDGDAGGDGDSGAPIKPPSTGNAGLIDNETAMWAASAVLFMAALGLGGAGILAATRARRS